jgi:NADPH:quinone reductase-like Zn-dependent oxidoreductase
LRIDSLPAVLLACLLGAMASAAEPTMRASVVNRAQIRVQQVARPRPAAGEVLVRLRYASVNPGDWKLAMGRADGVEDVTAGVNLPVAAAIPGFDGSGVVAALGPGVTGYRVGEAVILWSRARGTYAEYVAVSQDSIAAKPKNLSFAQAAGIGHAGLAAWNLLFDVARLRTGQTLLIVGGAGGVGSAAIQLAKSRGARVIATTSARNMDYVRTLGADQVIDYAAQHFEDQLRNVDVALNTVDADNANRAMAVVRRGGYLVSVAGLPAPTTCAAHAVICAGRSLQATPTGVVLRQIAELCDQRKFKVNVDRTFALSQVGEAWQYSQTGHTRGKSVIEINAR